MEKNNTDNNAKSSLKFLEHIATVRNLLKHMRTPQIIVTGFFVVIMIGTFLLNLPFASNSGKSIGFLNALFTSTSAVCVTGLVVVNSMEHWTLFGKAVILFLIQIGGLGFMTVITTIYIVLGRKITLKERLVIQDSLNQNDLNGMVRLARNVVLGTLLIEGVCAILLAIRFAFEPDIDILHALWYGLFHSISAFCNAGFDILGYNSLMNYYGDYLVMPVISFLIVVGGVGFAVWFELIKYFKRLRQDKNTNFILSYKKMNLHSKLALETTFILIVGAAIFFFIVEFNNPLTLMNMSLPQKITSAMFQSITTRTAGFNSIDQAGLTSASKFFTVILMFVGGSPGGTAGGVKTVTISLIILAVVSIIKGRNSITTHSKTIPFMYLQKALAVIIIHLSICLIATILLCITEKQLPLNSVFLDMLFEVVSATGTVGLTVGITPYLSVAGRLIICLCMFLGRLGPITVAVALTAKTMSSSNLVKYPEEKILVG